MKETIIAVDIGTQGTKAVLFDLALQTLVSSFEASVLIQPEPGTLWQEPDDIYGSVLRVVQALLHAAPEPVEVLALGVDSQMAGIMGIAADGEAATVYDSWLDSRCERYVTLMRERAGRRVTEITGGPVTFTHGPKILWWKHEHPEAYRRVAKFVLPHGYVVGKICGLDARAAVFDHTGLQYSGFGDNLHLCWSEELLETFDIEADKMARVVSPFAVVGTTSRAFAAATGLRAGTPVTAGAGDTAASLFGAGLFAQNRLLDCAGTASVLCALTDTFVPDTRFGTVTMMRAPEDGFWYPLAYISGGGLCLRWFRDQFTGTPPVSYRALDEEAAGLEPGSEGVVFVPHFAGRVLPSDTALKGGFTGLDWKHSRAHLYRAVMESIAYEYAYYLSVLRALYPTGDFGQLVSIGGGAQSELFLQIKADVLGVGASYYRTGDTALIGSAAIAGKAVGVIDDPHARIQDTLQVARTLPCDAAAHARYGPCVRRYLRVLEAMSALSRF
ncbi:MAG: hypothetical protein LBC26_06295 [Oscillospiraceae bacterium]|jgi:xylulokinase|nr:hypothetical protein [Oscillospiraceae bacterium]